MTPEQITRACQPKVGDRFQRGDAILEIIAVSDGKVIASYGCVNRIWDAAEYPELARQTIANHALFIPAP